MAKIAVELDRALAKRALTGAPAGTTRQVLAQGHGWSIADVLCTSGPHDRPFPEQHSELCIALVVSGTFQYRAGEGREMMTPGSLLLGNAGQQFECGHEHGQGDRCLVFGYAQDYFEHVAADAGVRCAKPVFAKTRVPPLRGLSPVTARATAGLIEPHNVSWEELSVHIAGETAQLVHGVSAGADIAPPGAAARVTRTVRAIERDPSRGLSLRSLAREARLSPYHFLRIFEELTGVTPHQYVLRTRLRQAAMRLIVEPAKVLDIALDCGFGDVSNFNRAFRAEFGVSPRAYRLATATGSAPSRPACFPGARYR